MAHLTAGEESVHDEPEASIELESKEVLKKQKTKTQQQEMKVFLMVNAETM